LNDSIKLDQSTAESKIVGSPLRWWYGSSQYTVWV
jgi:hypothetical protein